LVVPGWRDVADIWKNVREVDLRPIRQEALRDVKIALLGREGSGRQLLADQICTDPKRPEIRTHPPVMVGDLDSQMPLQEADLIVIMLTNKDKKIETHRRLAHQLSSTGKKVVVMFNQGEGRGIAPPEVLWEAQHFLVGSASDTDFLIGEFVPVLMDLLPDSHLPLGRLYPLFRVPIAYKLISDTSFSNAAYALSTGFAETVPVLDIPLNITDMIVLTKAQAFLVYRLGLAVGFSTHWQDYLTEFGSVIGGGFLWRQVARQLVGLIPIWGIVPKVAVAYAGTYVVGHVVLRWYLTGRHITPKQMRQLYRQSFRQGQKVARELIAKVPRPRLGKRERIEVSSISSTQGQSQSSQDDFQVCPECGKSSAADAGFCQYCGHPLSKPC
jgi:uncharacterized protein (DUF697 family)